MKKLQRLVRLHGGGEKFVGTPICECAERRGPKGGVCGNCLGAIPDDKGR